jgi:hypothetical protein
MSWIKDESDEDYRSMITFEEEDIISNFDRICISFINVFVYLLNFLDLVSGIIIVFFGVFVYRKIGFYNITNNYH